MIFAEVKSIIFKNKQNIPWNDVEDYLKGFIGIEIIVKEYGDVIYIQGDFPDEFTESRYTKKLRGALAKAKANAAQVIVEMLENAKIDAGSRIRIASIIKRQMVGGTDMMWDLLFQ